MFAPHNAKNTQLCEAGLASKQGQNFLIFIRRNAVFSYEFGSNGWRNFGM